MPHTLGFDIGGTFTDLAMLDAGGQKLAVHKVLTTPDDPARGALQGIKEFLHRDNVPYEELVRVVHATTLVTNALIEGKGVRVGLITTLGFRDVLEMGTEQRYDIYDLFLRYPHPLSPRHLRRGLNERIDRDGRVITPVDTGQLAAIVDEFRQQDVAAIAVTLLHSYRNPAHEKEVGAFVKERWPQVSVSLSSDIAAEIREYERTSTTVANAYVQPVVEKYLRQLESTLADAGTSSPLYPVASTGSVTTLPVALEQPVRLLESGPAAGAVLAGQLGQAVGQPDVLSFDMGGTTAKLCLVEGGRPHIAASMEAARVHRFTRGSGYPVRIPTVDMLEVGAGGGSIAWVDPLGLLKVGPASAGADPGPAAYGRGGTEATVTDADVVLGYLDPGHFLGGQMALDVDASRRAVELFGQRLGLGTVAAAAGIHRLVNDNMAAAARLHVIERARDPRRYALMCFGGAGPVHAAGVARTVGASEIIVPDRAGVASAVGVLLSPLAFESVRSYPVPLTGLDWAEIDGIFADMENAATALLRDAGVEESRITAERSVEGRFVGQLHEIRVPLPADLRGLNRADFIAAFHRTYEQLYRHLPGDLDVELLTWHTRVAGPAQSPPAAAAGRGGDVSAARKGTRAAYFPDAGDFVDTAVYERGLLSPGMRIVGPALVEERESTTVVPPGLTIHVDEYANLRIRPSGRE